MLSTHFHFNILYDIVILLNENNLKKAVTDMSYRDRKKTEASEFSDTGVMRINKFLSDAGYCSRREADRLILEGKVFVDGQAALIGQKVKLNQNIVINGKKLSYKDKLILIALNKPQGIECTTDKSNPDNIVDFVGYKDRIYPVGRLDRNSHGLILLTNDGVMGNNILKASNYHEKEYIVVVNKEIDDKFIKTMSEGVPILNTVTRPCVVRKEGKCKFRIIITQGLNRQIRRMCEYCGYKVMDLKRIRILNIRLANLKEGEYRHITDDELAVLKEMIK